MKKQYVALLTALAFLTPATLQAMTEDQDDIKAFDEMFPAGEPTEADFYQQDRLLISATGSLKPDQRQLRIVKIQTLSDRSVQEVSSQSGN